MFRDGELNSANELSEVDIQACSEPNEDLRQNTDSGGELQWTIKQIELELDQK